MAKQLYKSDNKMIDGVCAGFAEYADLDPTVVRALYALFTVFTGIVPGVIAYVVLMVIMPRKGSAKNGKKVSKA